MGTAVCKSKQTQNNNVGLFKSRNNEHNWPPYRLIVIKMTDASIRRKSSPSSDSEDLIVIREIYDSENAQEIFEIELERAIQSGCQTIIIEPTELGEETENWIAYGNYLHRSAIGTGVFAVFSGVYWKDLRFLHLPLVYVQHFTLCVGDLIHAAIIRLIRNQLPKEVPGKDRSLLRQKIALSFRL